AGGRIACAGEMALVARRANHWVGAAALPRLAGVAPCAGVVVVALGAVCLRWIRANPCRLVASPRDVTLVTGDTHDCDPRLANAAGVTSLCAVAGVSVRAR